jgi:hypothetical protein
VTGSTPPGAFRRLWADWEAFWDEREHPISLALVRILLGLCWSYDFLTIGWLDLVVPLFGVGEVGGFSDALIREGGTPLFYRLFPGTVASAHGLHAVMTLAALCVTVGFFTRTSCLVLLVAWAQFVDILPYADRGIDTLSRLTLLVLMCSGAGATLSVDARMRTGRFAGSGAPIFAYARRLLILQVVVMYFGAAVQKVGITWWPMGHFAALYFSLRDPAVAAWDFSFLRHQPFFFFTQIGVVTTILYQGTYPLVLLLLWWRRHPGAGGWIGRLSNRWRLEWIWIGIGGLFHVILGVTMNLGIFPWAMLALYPIFVTPDEWQWVLRRVGLPLAPADS